MPMLRSCRNQSIDLLCKYMRAALAFDGLNSLIGRSKISKTILKKSQANHGVFFLIMIFLKGLQSIETSEIFMLFVVYWKFLSVNIFANEYLTNLQ